MNCSERVYKGHGFSGSPCSRKGIIERDGRHYCKQHDPVAVKAREEASNAKWRAAYEERKQQRMAEAEQKRRADCFDDLLAALEECRNVLAAELSAHTRHEVEKVPYLLESSQAVQYADAAIDKAKEGQG